MFELRCKDVGFDCPGVIRGTTPVLFGLGHVERMEAQYRAHYGDIHPCLLVVSSMVVTTFINQGEQR